MLWQLEFQEHSIKELKLLFVDIMDGTIGIFPQI